MKKRKRLGNSRIKALLLQGSAMQIPLKDKSVQLCCFSPPYWGLRKYEIPPLVFGGEIDCEHKWKIQSVKIVGGHSGGIESSGLSNAKKRAEDTGSNQDNQYSFCSLCGAWRGDLGLEPTPELYLDNMMLVMAEVWRVLRNDGVCFVNIGDTYSTHTAKRSGQFGKDIKKGFDDIYRKARAIPYREKSLCLVPQKLAIRCQEAGWIIRSEIIWAKPNPMPESVKDRPTRSHEQVWMMTKQGKYYWDKEAVRESSQASEASSIRAEYGRYDACTGKAKRDYREGKPDFLQAIGNDYGGGGRNIRDVWTLATEPTPDAHFASWPKKLVARMIRVASAVNDIVLDPFCGTGKTIAEAERFNRIGVGLDLSHSYLLDIAVPRKKKAEAMPKTLGFMEELGIG